MAIVSGNERDRLAVDGFLDYLTHQRNMSPQTVRAYSLDLNQYLVFLGHLGMSVAEATHKTARAYLASLMSRGLSRRSAARKLTALKGYYSFLSSRDQAYGNPFVAISPPKAPGRLPSALKIKEVAKLLGAPDRETPLGLRDAAILEILYASGARVSEVVGLDVGDTRGSLVRLYGKGSKERLAPVAGEAVEAVERYSRLSRPVLAKREGGEERALFLSKSGRRLSADSVRAMVRGYAQAAGVPGAVTPHSFRHSFATHLLEGGAGIRAVQELLGHVDLSSTQIYTHLSKSGLKKIHSQAHPRA